MSGILRIENLNKGTTLKQGDKTVLSYRLSDADGEQLSIAGKTAVARLMHPDFTRIGYESEALTVSADNIVQFSIDSIIPSRLYYLEITVDGQYIFPSRSDEGKLSIDRSSMGAEITIIENAGIDTVVRKAVDLINDDPSLIIDEDKLVSEIIANTSLGSIEEYYQEYRDVIKELSENKDYHSLPEIAGARGGFDTLGERLEDTDMQLSQTKQSFNDAVSEVTVDSEVILARGEYTTLGERVDEIVAGDGLNNGAVTPSKTSFLKRRDGLNIATDFVNSYIGGSGSDGFTYLENYSNSRTMIIPIEPSTKYSVIMEGSTSNVPKITTTPQILTHNEVITSAITYASGAGKVIESGSDDVFLYFSFLPDETLPFVKVVKSDVVVPIVDEDTMYYASGFKIDNITPSETTFARFSENSEEKDYETRNFSDFHDPANDGQMMQANGSSITTGSTTNYTFTLPIPVAGGAKYKFAYRSFCIFNKDGQPIGWSDNSGYGNRPTQTRTDTMPVDAEYIIVNLHIDQVDTAEISRRSAIGDERAIRIDNLEISTEKPLANKNILVMGDSLNANYSPNVSDIIADETGASVVNGALGGSRMCFTSGGAGNGSTGSQLIKSLVSGDWTSTLDDINDRRTGSLLTKQLATVADLQIVDLNNIDLVVIAYGTNDRLQSIGIGSDTDDETKFKGALRIAIETLLSNYNHLKIMFVGQPFSHKHSDTARYYGEYEPNPSGHVLGDYVEAMQEVADKYHVGFLDNYTNAGMNEFNTAFYFNTNDGLHGKQETFIPLLADRYIKKIEDVLTQVEV